MWAIMMRTGMPEHPTLATAFTAPDAKRRYVRRLFATIADRYDLITGLLSFGRDRHWKARLVSLVAPRPGARTLDLACGTGDIAFEAAARGARVTGVDITLRMLELAQEKRCRVTFYEKRKTLPGVISWCAGDMCALPIANESIETVTTGYGLRNVPDLPRALAEIHRVLTPGGTVGSLDFDKPEVRWLRGVYLTYLTVVGGALGWALHRDPDTYRYIPASIRRYPGARGVCALMRDAGFVEVRHLPVFGGLMAIHLARKSGSRAP